MRYRELAVIGFWYEPFFLGRPPGVDPTRLVEPDWAGAERQQLIRYLRAGYRSRPARGFSYCRFACGVARELMGSRDFTDGTWIWPEGLAHYVEEHGICLPDVFLDHARRKGFVVPPRMDGHKGSRDLEFPLRRGSDALWMNWAARREAIV